MGQNSLDNFLKEKNIDIQREPCESNDGYISPAQKQQFKEVLSHHPNIRKIAEIGFNAGHSAEYFFQQVPSLQFFASFDLNYYPCTRIAVEYFYRTYPNRFLYIQGDSLVKVPELHKKAPSLLFDLIYIDGCHRFQWSLGDIMNGEKIAAPNALLWIDDVDPDFQNGVGAAVKCCESLGIIAIEKFFSSEDPLFGKRNWIQAKYS